ncbi:hypothetical protein ACTA71_000505 [Dictyostelium dimigraforme]
MVTANPLHEDVGLFLVQCLLIIFISRCVTWLFAKIQQPPVIAEIISGILLGPTALGKIPGFSSNLFTTESLKILNVFAQIGLVFFMFIIGLELDPTLFRGQIKKSLLISAASIAIPFGLGIAASVYLAEIQDTAWTYSLGIFIGVALCITAFPVLARILTARKLLATKIGILAIACAAINDICGWILLGVSVSLAGSSGSLDALWTLLASAVFVVILIVVIRPVLLRIVAKIWKVDAHGHPPHPSNIIMSGTVFLLFVCSLATEWIGIHAMFGAFTLGAIMPKTHGFNQAITEKIEDLVLVFLLPLYFVISGLRTDLTTLNTGESWLGVLVIISCACAGKILGAGFMARILGSNTRDSFYIGVLMNTRGLVELIVLNLGLDFKIIEPNVFGIMVLMAVFTTILTSPIISLFNKKPKKAIPGEQTVVLCTSSINIGPSLVDLGYCIGNKVQATGFARRKLKKIYLLALAEVNDRPSDFISQIRKDMSKEAFTHLSAQSQHLKMKVSIKSIVSDNDNLSKDVLEFSESRGAGLLIIGEDSRQGHGRGGNLSSDVVYSLIKNSNSHVGLFTDKSGSRGGYHRFKRILLAYNAQRNPNDQEALNIANTIASSNNSMVTIIVFDNELYWDQQKKLKSSHDSKLLIHSQPIVDNDLNNSNNNNNNNNNIIVNNSELSSGAAQNNSILTHRHHISADHTLSHSETTPTTHFDINNIHSIQPTPKIGDNQLPINTPTSVTGADPTINNGSIATSSNPSTSIPFKKFETHLESVIYGKNKSSINVIYKPQRSRLKVLLSECSNYDLLIVPFEPTKQNINAFPSFHVPGIDIMKKSLSMVHLPGYKKNPSSSSPLAERDNNRANNDVEHLEEFDDHPHIKHGSSNNLSGSFSKTSANNASSSNLNNSNPLGKAGEFADGHVEVEMDNLRSSDGSDHLDDEPYWSKCPISTLVIHHKDTIPHVFSELSSNNINNHKKTEENDTNNNSNNSNNNNNNDDNNNNNNIILPDDTPYEVDPSDLKISQTIV